MKILVIADKYPSEENPIACIFIKEQVAALGKKHEVCVLVVGRRFVSISPRNLVRYLFGMVKKLGTTRSEIIGNRERSDGEEVRRIEYTVYTLLKSPLHILNGLSLYFTVLKTFKELNFNPDLIYAHKSFPAGYAGWRLKRRFKIPVVTMEFQGPFSSYFDEPHRGKRVIETINNVDRTVYTRSQVEEIKAHGGKSEKLGFAHFGVNTDRFMFDRDAHDARAKENRKGRFKLLVVSRIEEAKGIRYLIGAIDKLRGKFPGMTLTMVGPLERGGETILSLIDALKLRDRIVFRGICTNDELPSLIHEHDILVSASLFETFGVTLIEAMACGKPVVATKCGGPEETVNERVGVLVEKANAQALAEGIKFVMENYEEYNPQKIRAYAVENFSHDVAIARLKKSSGKS